MESESIKTFLKENNVVGFSVAMIVALTLKDLVEAFIGNLLVPGINTFLLSLQIKSFSKYLPGGDKINLLPVIKALITFLFTFMVVYLSITTVFAAWTRENKK
jgi:large-conductance mechanosensitive channel